MNIKNVSILKGMHNDDVNFIFKNNNVNIKLIDELYLGSNFSHNWTCECGEIIHNRAFGKIKSRNSLLCNTCMKNRIKENHKIEVEKDGEYEYINTYFKDDKLPNGEVVHITTLEIKHLYCNEIYLIKSIAFINNRNQCSKCCQRYENSFAYHIEVELGEPLEKYWDFEKNTVNPYLIRKHYVSSKVWIKCQEKDYHGSYEISCSKFYAGRRCGYCRKQNKVHLYDSFGFNNLDKILNWSPDNYFSPFSISDYSSKYIKLFCYECNNAWETRAYVVSKLNCWCPVCAQSHGEKKIREWLCENSIKYIPQKEYNNLIGLGGGKLSYDFYVPEFNTLIEYQGEFHDGTAYQQTNEEYRIQQEHDKRKCEYAKNNNIELLEIWYPRINDIEEILKNKFKL